MQQHGFGFQSPRDQALSGSKSDLVESWLSATKDQESYDAWVLEQQALDSPAARMSRQVFETVMSALSGVVAGGREGNQASIFGELLASAVPFVGPGRQMIKTLAGKVVPKGIRAFHGGPRNFERFDMSKIGTGEGAQARGHGLYFAENPTVGRFYQHSVSRKEFTRKVSQVYEEYDDPYEAIEALNDAGLNAGELRLVEALRKDGWFGFDYPHQAVDAALGSKVRNFDPSPETLKAIDEVGALFEVNLRVNPEDLLDLDLPLGQQSPQVRQAVESFQSPGSLERLGTRPMGKVLPRSPPSAGQEFSQNLRKAGVPGSRFLDQASRARTAGTRNIVMFDDDLIDIIKKLSLVLSTGGGAALALQQPKALEQ